jgi:hypothetical protein
MWTTAGNYATFKGNRLGPRNRIAYEFMRSTEIGGKIDGRVVQSSADKFNLATFQTERSLYQQRSV